jgi:hypothetical protein
MNGKLTENLRNTKLKTNLASHIQIATIRALMCEGADIQIATTRALMSEGAEVVSSKRI